MAQRPTLIQRAARWLVTKAAVAPVDLSAFDSRAWTPIVGEPFQGAWQRNISLDMRGTAAFPAVFACINVRARAIAKLRIKLMEQELTTGIWSEIRGNSPFTPVLRKPNRYQTRIQFIFFWMVMKLLYGNTYVYKERDQRRIVTAMHVLDSRRVTVKVASDGSVWYDLGLDKLSNGEPTIVSAREIIHDRGVCLWHVLIGVSPIYAAGMAASMGVKIQENSAQFFANMSAPSGHLSAPAKIDDITAARLKREAEGAMGGVNLGRLFVTGDGIKYEPFTMPAVDAQLVEQLKMSVEHVASAFGVPLHKIMAGAMPQVGNMAALDQAFYQDTCQEDIESIELLLDEGLGLVDVDGKTYGTELDLDGLLRLDPKTRAEVQDIQVKAGVLKPNEARASENRGPVEGGDECYLQQQNYSLPALGKRDAKPDPFGTDKPPAALPAPKPEPVPQVASDAKSAELATSLVSKFLRESDLVAA